MGLALITAGLRSTMMAVGMLIALHAAAGPAQRDASSGVLVAGHDPVDPALKRFTGKVTGLGAPDKGNRVSTLRFDPIGPGMVAPQPDELRGWRLTFIKGKMFGQAVWVQGNSTKELTVRDTDPSLADVVEGDILMIELLDPNLTEPGSSRNDDAAPRVA